MSESSQRKRVIEALHPLHGCAVENPAGPGTPDVNYVEGWIELKQLDHWPDVSGPVRIEHYTMQQRFWAVNRRLAGGQCWFLLRVKREWLLMDGATAAIHVGIATRQQLYELSTRHWKTFNGKELLECVSQRQNAYWSTAEERLKLRRQLLGVLRSLSHGT